MDFVAQRVGTHMFDAARIETPYLAAKNLRWTKDSTHFIDVEALCLAGRGITVIMGPNGAGKSLLLRLLHGLVQPSRGEIFCHGEPLSPATRRAQSLVLQSPVLLRRTAQSNVRFVLKARGLDVGAAPELLKRVGLDAKANTPARRLSGGEQQRLAIAQALATNPSTLLLDEPTASLDPRSTGMIEDILRTTNAQGTRVVMVTHDAMQARRLADHIVFLSEGRVVEQTAAGRFFERPSTEQARAYLAGRLST